ncbi:AAA family ATPase [Leptospira neocaledonica]|uniref:AAA family ATPase n=1 Tax=Leptospira neocaledonica TaxID=2023192 RepID=UPI000F64FA6D|nr:AAA family ATPase [Leptospira neocaledonica]
MKSKIRMKHLIIVAGPNGSGKTTFALEHQEVYGYTFLNADELEKGLENRGTTSGHLEAGRLFFKAIERELKLGNSLIIESTLSGNYLKGTIRKFSRSKRNFWGMYRSLTDTWAAYFNAEENSECFALGGKHSYDILNSELLSIFLQDIDEDE